MLLSIVLNCGHVTETSNKDNHSLLTSSSTTTTKATISPLPTTIPTPPTATLTAIKVSDLLAG